MSSERLELTSNSSNAAKQEESSVSPRTDQPRSTLNNHSASGQQTQRCRSTDESTSARTRSPRRQRRRLTTLRRSQLCLLLACLPINGCDTGRQFPPPNSSATTKLDYANARINDLAQDIENNATTVSTELRPIVWMVLGNNALGALALLALELIRRTIKRNAH